MQKVVGSPIFDTRDTNPRTCLTLALAMCTEKERPGVKVTPRIGIDVVHLRGCKWEIPECDCGWPV